MTAREDLAEVINNGVGTWRTPLEAADAILGALAPQRGALDAVLALHKSAHRKVEPWATGYRWTGDHCAYDGESWPCRTVAAVNDALEAGK